MWLREEGPNGSQGGGAVLLVIKGTANHTFTDVVPYFHARFGWLTRMVSNSQWLKPLSTCIQGTCMRQFSICWNFPLAIFADLSIAKQTDLPL